MASIKGKICMIFSLVVPLTFVGCKPAANSSQQKTQYRYVDSDANTAGPNTGDTSMEAPSSTDNPSTAVLKADYEKAAANLKAHPKDKKTRTAFIAASDRYAAGEMVDPNIDRKIKYKTALELYRAVLKVDPNDVEAKNNSAIIIDIYNKLGKQPPT